MIGRMEISTRVTRWVFKNFDDGSADQVLAELRALPSELIGGQDTERIQAALVLGGSWSDFQLRLITARADWRDLLMGAGLGHQDWRARLDEVLGPN
jgi:hypothetical protein